MASFILLDKPLATVWDLIRTKIYNFTFQNGLKWQKGMEKFQILVALFSSQNLTVIKCCLPAPKSSLKLTTKAKTSLIGHESDMYA